MPTKYILLAVAVLSFIALAEAQPIYTFVQGGAASSGCVVRFAVAPVEFAVSPVHFSC